MTKALTIVIPAAGRSTRMAGRDKLLEDVGGQPLLRLVARRAVQVAPVRVVLAQGQDDRRRALEGLDLEIVETAPGGGMGDSLATGVAGLKSAVMILLPDMPDISAHDLARLSALWQAGAGPILRGADLDGTPGHPVILPSKLLPKLAALTGDRGAAPVLAAHAKDVAHLPLGPQALLDLDTPEDWAAWRKGAS